MNPMLKQIDLQHIRETVVRTHHEPNGNRLLDLITNLLYKTNPNL